MPGSVFDGVLSEGRAILGAPSAAVATNGKSVFDDALSEGRALLGAPAAAAAPEQEEPGKLEAVLRGVKQGATLGFGDELTGLVESIFTDKSYKQARDEARANDKAAQKAHGILYGAGEIGGGLATAFVPGLNVAKGASVAATAGKAALAGAIGGVGGSDAEDVASVAKDAAIGGVAGGVLGGAVAKAGQTIGKFIGNAGKRVEGRLIEDVGHKALPSTRTQIAEMAPDVVEALKGTKLDKVVKDPKLLKSMTAETREAITGKTDALWTAVDEQLGGQHVKPVLKALQAEQTRLAGNPAEAARASKLGKIIAQIEDQHLPPEELSKESLLRRLTAGAGKAKEKIGARSDDVVETMKVHDLTGSVKDPKTFADKVTTAMGSDGQKIDAVWKGLDGPAATTTVGDVIAPLEAMIKKAADDPAKANQVAALEGLIGKVRGTWGKTAEGVSDEVSVPLRKVRDFVTTLQTEGFESGSFVDPLSAKKFQRKIAGTLKDVVDSHLAEHAPEAAKDLAKLNKQYSILKDLDGIAKRRAAAAEINGGGVTGTGKISSQDLRSLIDSIGPEPHIKPTKKNSFERRVAGILGDFLDNYARKGTKLVPEAAELPRLQRFSRALESVQAAADRRANLAQFPPTGIREIGEAGGHGGLYGEAKRMVVGAADSGLRKIDPTAALVAERLKAMKADRLRRAMRQIPVSYGSGIGQAMSTSESEE